MRYTVRILLFLIILGVMFVGCYLKLGSETKTEQYTGPQTVEALMKTFDARYNSHEMVTTAEILHGEKRLTEANRAHPEAENWFMVGENALPQVPGRIYVLKTESTAQIWHTCSERQSDTGEVLSATGPELSEKQRLNLLNTGAVPKGWEVVYVDENGNPTYRNR